MSAADPHPDVDQALYVDDHGPAFPPPWLEEAEAAAAERPQQAAIDRLEAGERRGLIAQLEADEADPHELTALRANERPAGYRPDDLEAAGG